MRKDGNGLKLFQLGVDLHQSNSMKKRLYNSGTGMTAAGNRIDIVVSSNSKEMHCDAL